MHPATRAPPGEARRASGEVGTKLLVQSKAPPSRRAFLAYLAGVTPAQPAAGMTQAASWSLRPGPLTCGWPAESEAARTSGSSSLRVGAAINTG